MLKNFILTGIRLLLKKKAFTIINISGLAIGMAACILISQYVIYEHSYDRFHTKADRIYRIQYNEYQNGNLTFECAAAVPAVGPALKDNFAEVEEYARMYPVSGVINYRDPVKGLLSFREKKMQVATPSVFRIFDFKLVEGDTGTALKGLNEVVISKRVAKKIFGDGDPVNKILTLEGKWDLKVTGVMEDVPPNSHIKFDYLISFLSLDKESENESETSWGWYDFNTYVLLKPATDVATLQKKWDQYLLKTRGEEWTKYNDRQEFIFQPLTDIHLYSNLLQESEPQDQGDGKAVYFLAILAGFILVIAWINYINLTTARSVERASEVGVRKALGASYSQLVRQFLTESFFVNLAGLIASLLIVILSEPFYDKLTGRPIHFLHLKQPVFWFAAGLLFIAGTLLSGLYPALFLSSYKPMLVLKGKFSGSRKGKILREGLVIFQFATSIFLITGTVIVYRQVGFMMNQDLGININKTLVINGPGVIDSTYHDKLSAFKTELLRDTHVHSVTASTSIPGNEIFWTNDIRRVQGGPEGGIVVYNAGIDNDYIPAYDLKLLAGRNFSSDIKSDKRALIINESMAKMLEFNSPEEALNEKVITHDTFTIIGVLKDYHQMSLKNKTQPIIFKYIPSTSNFYSIKADLSEKDEIMGRVDNLWSELFPGNPVDYFYLDQYFNKQYDKDKQFGNVFSIFSFLAILIACLGLSGLASYSTIQRTKEIGVRKILGSSVSGIVFLLAKDFMKPIIISIVLAIPFTYLIMINWLNNFPYHIGINWFLFVSSAFLIVLLSIITVSVQTIRSALTNPAISLRYE